MKIFTISIKAINRARYWMIAPISLRTMNIFKPRMVVFIIHEFIPNHVSNDRRSVYSMRDVISAVEEHRTNSDVPNMRIIRGSLNLSLTQTAMSTRRGPPNNTY